MDELLQAFQGALAREKLAVFTLVLARLIPVIGLTPLFGGQLAPRRLRFGFALLFALALAPSVALSAEVAAKPLPLLWLGETLLGLILATVVRLVFEVVSMLGGLVDATNSSAQATIADPWNRAQQSLLSVFMLYLFLAVFCAAGGLTWLLRALGDSLVGLPLGTVLESKAADPRLAHAFLDLFGELFAVAVRLASPVIGTMLLIDAGLALVNRVAGQVQVYFLGMTFKASVGILFLAWTLGWNVTEFLAALERQAAVWFPG